MSIPKEIILLLLLLEDLRIVFTEADYLIKLKFDDIFIVTLGRMIQQVLGDPCFLHILILFEFLDLIQVGFQDSKGV